MLNTYHEGLCRSNRCRTGAHAAGRPGFYTELRVRQGVDALTAAKAGRLVDASLPDCIYGHPKCLKPICGSVSGQTQYKARHVSHLTR